MGKIFKVVAVVFAALTVYVNIKNAQNAADFLIGAFIEYDEDNE